MRDIIVAALLVNVLGCSTVSLMHPGLAILLIVGTVLFLLILAGIVVAAIYAAEGLRRGRVLAGRWHEQWCANWQEAEFRGSALRTAVRWALPVGAYLTCVYLGFSL